MSEPVPTPATDASHTTDPSSSSSSTTDPTPATTTPSASDPPATSTPPTTDTPATTTTTTTTPPTTTDAPPASTASSPASPVPAQFRAIVQSGYSQEPSAVLSLSSSEGLAAPQPHEITVQVYAASVNPLDVKLVHGSLALVIRLSFPHVPGFDFSGKVVAVGPAVTRLKVGDEVCGTNGDNHGVFAEYVNMDEKYMSLKPGGVSWVQAAALPIVGITALQALEKGGIAAGQKVMVIGGSGGVGSLAIQVAKLLGASHVTSVNSGKNADFVKGLGADEVIDYTSSTISSGSKDYDIVLDTVGGKEQWVQAQLVLKDKGNFVTLIGDDASQEKLSVAGVASQVAQVATRKLSSFFGPHHNYYLHRMQRGHATLDRLTEWLGQGKLKIPIEKEYDFTKEAVVAAIEEIAKGRTRGKLVINVIKDNQ